MKIDELNKKREMFRNDFNNIKRYENKLKQIIIFSKRNKNRNRNRAEEGLEDRIFTLLQLFHI